ncbi:hypothetical protein AVEN_125006-1 [Araneus ventricosus]|uniref:Uncharacterized protein n=1 Tax=Araneus ventricosus TaxID=182803 RepID=A0A4Y2T3L6_ARAVE|nr:hypothetical protein AVEN_125006-1 [Araneus ventricosus]
MRSDESIFSLLQNNGRGRVRRKLKEAMDHSCIVPNVQANGILVCGSFNGSGLRSETLFDNKLKSQQLNVFNDQVIPSMEFFLPLELAYSNGQCKDPSMQRSTELFTTTVHPLRGSGTGVCPIF